MSSRKPRNSIWSESPSRTTCSSSFRTYESSPNIALPMIRPRTSVCANAEAKASRKTSWPFQGASRPTTPKVNVGSGLASSPGTGFDRVRNDDRVVEDPRSETRGQRLERRPASSRPRPTEGNGLQLELTSRRLQANSRPLFGRVCARQLVREPVARRPLRRKPLSVS